MYRRTGHSDVQCVHVSQARYSTKDASQSGFLVASCLVTVANPLWNSFKYLSLFNRCVQSPDLGKLAKGNAEMHGHPSWVHPFGWPARKRIKMKPKVGCRMSFFRFPAKSVTIMPRWAVNRATRNLTQNWSQVKNCWVDSRLRKHKTHGLETKRHPGRLVQTKIHKAPSL